MRVANTKNKTKNLQNHEQKTRENKKQIKGEL
jgi:hypothetical protein